MAIKCCKKNCPKGGRGNEFLFIFLLPKNPKAIFPHHFLPIFAIGGQKNICLYFLHLIHFFASSLPFYDFNFVFAPLKKREGEANSILYYFLFASSPFMAKSPPSLLPIILCGELSKFSIKNNFSIRLTKNTHQKRLQKNG